MSRMPRFLAVSGLLLCAAAATAHHSSDPHFDSTRPLTLTGVVTQFRLVNPHAYVYFDVTGADGTVAHWNCEMNSASLLQRSGWTVNTFVPGSQVTINGIAARRDPHGCSFNSAVLKDGTRLDRAGTITRAGAAAAVTEAKAAPVKSKTFGGTWITAAMMPPGGARGDAANGGPSSDLGPFARLMTEAGKAAAAKYDARYDDPALRCSASSIIRGWSEPNSVSEITQTATTITIRHEYMDTVRVVDLRTRTHPKTLPRSMTGHSVGWFEGTTLVIDTVGFEAGVLLPHPGVMNSEDMHIVERLSLSEDGSQLKRDFVVTDARYLGTPVTGSNTWTRTTIPLSKYNCTELSGINNVRPAATAR